MHWVYSEDGREVRCNLGIVLRQRGAYRVLVTNVNGMSDVFWYYLWFSNPHTSMKPMPQGIMDCAGLFAEGTIREWIGYLKKAQEGAERRKKSICG